VPNWQEKLAQIALRNRQEIVNAKLSRRELVRMGLLTPAGGLVMKAGLNAEAQAQVNPMPGVTAPPSPLASPWAQAMPRIQEKLPVSNPDDMTYGHPDGFTLVDGGRKRVAHQHCSYDDVTGEYGGKFAPKKFYELFVQEAQWKFHPSWGPSKVWGYDGRYPGPRIKAYYGEPVMVRYHNRLPSKTKHVGFGMPAVTTHLHNAHTPTESDGHPTDFCGSYDDRDEVNAYGFKDQHYPNVRAGYTARGDNYGDPNEALGSLWYHDHHVDFTAQNVYRGLAGIYTLFDDLDTGDETTGLRLPSGEYDVPIMFGDFVFDKNYQVVYDLFNTDGILGDRFTANGVIQPYFNVSPRRYRFRLYTHGPSRWWDFALWDGSKYLPFWQIASDGNLLPKALQRTSVRLSPAERCDIVVDFSKIQGSRIYLVNRMEMDSGRRPDDDLLKPGRPVIQFNKSLPTAPDYSADPSAGGGMTLRPLPDPDFNALLQKASKLRKRVWKFERTNGSWAVNGKFYEPDRPHASIPQESEEVWVFQNSSGGWAHPIHMHFEEVRVLRRNGRTIAANSPEYGRKDVIPLDANQETQVFVRLRDMKGRYVMHCHNSVHEDLAMMIRFDIV
jgi:FtsP/CotA-like multicopper oxidase with cupredoxin domain